MAPRPLRRGLLALAAALWAGAAAAADVAAPRESGPAPAPGVSGAAAGALGPSAVGAVAPLTSLPTALSAPAAAPLSPAASPSAAALPASAPLAVAPPAAAGAASPAAAPAAAPAAKAKTGKAKPGPSSDAPSSPPAHLVAQAMALAQTAPKGAAAAPGPGASASALALDPAKSGQFFDGAKTVAPSAAGPQQAPAPLVPALSPLAKGAPASGPEKHGPPVVAAPQPEKVPLAEAVQVKAQGLLAGAWTGLKSALAPKPKALSPEAMARIEAMSAPIVRRADDPLETPEGLLVHAPRPLRFSALGYRLAFAAPQGAPSRAGYDHPVRVSVERGASGAGLPVLRARFTAFNALIEENFAALELIAQSSSKMTVKTARAVMAKVEAMADLYAEMIGRDQAREELEGVANLKRVFERAVAGSGDAEPLSPAVANLIMPIDKSSAHSYINALHQAALSEVGRTGSSAQANMTVRVGRGRDPPPAHLLDLSEHPLVSGGRLVAPAFKALVEALRRSKDNPKGSLILQDHQFWGHFRLGAHSAEVYANFLPPDEGGMLRVRYQEWDTGYDNQTRLYYVARLLQKTGFHVEQDNGFLTAVVDKDHASQSVDEMTDTFALVIQALHATVGIDFALPMLVQGAKSSAEVGRRIDQWVDVVLGEGTLPFYLHDDHDGMMEGWTRYRAGDGARMGLRRGLDRTLARLGLPPIPVEARIGQRTIDQHFNAPIEAALARGQLRLTDKGVLEKSPGYDELAAIARAVHEDPVGAARMAEVVSSLDPGLFAFETVGSLGALAVERAQRRLEPGEIVVVQVLRDPKGGQIAFAEASVSDLKPGGSPRRLAPAELFTKLAEQGYPIAPFTPSRRPPGLQRFVDQLGADSPADRSMGRRAQGIAASPAHGRPILAQVTYDKAQAARGGRVFVAAYTTPDDLEAIRASKAVITTSGGLLSHAAITTREMGIPAVILPRARWRAEGAAFDSPAFGEAYRFEGMMARRASPVPPAELPEGALVRLDPAAGSVEIFTPAIAQALQDAALALERYDRERDARSLLAWVGARLAEAALTTPQKAALVREALDGLAARASERPEALADLAAYHAALPSGKDELGLWVQAAAADLAREEARTVLETLAEKRQAVAQAISLDAVERAARQGRAAAARLSALTEALRQPKARLLQTVAAAERLEAEARARGEALLAEDIAELEAHAREFPNATVEVLPRLKAAIAKARRRGAPEQVIARWEAQALALEQGRERAMRAGAPLVLPLKSVLDMDVTRVGGKASKLGEVSEVVARAGGEVPPGVALTVDAYRRFLSEAGIAERLERVAADRALSPEERSARARALILAAPLSPSVGVGRAIVESVRQAGLERAMLAVRSSAVDEDGAEAAFAGAGDTHLYVAPRELLAHVREVWASLWNPRALLYRQSKGLSTANLAQAVVVQAMVDSQVSGVAFTADPVTGDTSRLVVNGAFGLGEGVVSGRVAPDQFVVGKRLGREVLPPMIADKKLAVLRGKDGRGTEERRMPPEWRRRRSMTPAKLERLNAVAVALESHFGYPLDIEFGFVEDKLYILQARPVTGAAPEEARPPALNVSRPAPDRVQEAAAPPDARRLLFVCTGNTCRSPMAERLAKARLAREGRPGFEVLSRGLAVAGAGGPMSRFSRQVLSERGADPEGHLALPFMDSDAIWADLILTMTRDQAKAVQDAFPAARGKVFVLGEYAGTGGDIADPVGGSVESYRAAASQIAAGVDAALDRAEASEPAPR